MRSGGGSGCRHGGGGGDPVAVEADALCCWAVSVDDLALVGARIGNTETR